MKKILYIFISLIISLLVFNSIQTNRVYIKAVVKNDCTIEMVYTNLKNEETTVYKRIYKYSDENIYASIIAHMLNNFVMFLIIIM